MADNQPKATTSRYVVDGMELISVTNILGQLDKSGALIPWAVKLCSKYINDNYKPNMTSDEFDALCLDAKTKYKEVSEDAMDTGTKIHDLIEVYIKQGRDAVGEMKDEVENGFLAFLDWEEKNIDTWIESERPVFDLVKYGLTDIASFLDGFLKSAHDPDWRMGGFFAQELQKTRVLVERAGVRLGLQKFA